MISKTGDCIVQHGYKQRLQDQKAHSRDGRSCKMLQALLFHSGTWGSDLLQPGPARSGRTGHGRHKMLQHTLGIRGPNDCKPFGRASV